jgi:hypothetical protein
MDMKIQQTVDIQIPDPREIQTRITNVQRAEYFLNRQQIVLSKERRIKVSA